jgi:biopolymer transport protein TolR
MSARRQRIRKRPMSQINVVPYIDVMLVLLVLFMITAPLLTQGVKVDLPQAATETLDAEQNEPLVLSVDADGRFYLNIGGDPKEPLQPDTILARTAALLREKPKTPILVNGDRGVEYGRIIQAMVLLQQAGAANVGLMTEPPPAPAG